MNKEYQEKNEQIKKKNDNQEVLWNEAIRDTEIELEASEKRCLKLRRAIQTFKNNRDMGRPWPGQTATQN